MDIVIHHNLACGMSRNVLKFVQDAGYDPVVVEYLDVGWTRSQLQALFAAANLTPRTALRTSKSPAKELGLLDEAVSDEFILDQMIAHPILVNRPIVACKKGVKLCRPAQVILDLLDNWPAGPWAKEDGSLILDAAGKRV